MPIENNSQCFRRTLSGERPRAITDAERSIIIYTLMSELWYGNKIDEYGIANMLKSKVLIAAYPLHDGYYKWTIEGNLSDRQVNVKYS